jgi:hypothetical protein
MQCHEIKMIKGQGHFDVFQIFQCSVKKHTYMNINIASQLGLCTKYSLLPAALYYLNDKSKTNVRYVKTLLRASKIHIFYLAQWNAEWTRNVRRNVKLIPCIQPLLFLHKASVNLSCIHPLLTIPAYSLCFSCKQPLLFLH